MLKTGLKEMQSIIESILTEERKLHESLKKYKKDEDGESLSDFDKMNLQIYVVRAALKL